MNLNQLTIIGFCSAKAETKYLPNGTAVTKFSVATKRSWKDENDEWKEKSSGTLASSKANVVGRFEQIHSSGINPITQSGLLNA
jgi:hypothetical protein